MKELGLPLLDVLAQRAYEGHKTQTRHPLKGKALELYLELESKTDEQRACFDFIAKKCTLYEMSPWGIPGDRIYVREAIAIWEGKNQKIYRACREFGKLDLCEVEWLLNYHMPREFARTVADVVNTSIQRIQDITDEDCIAEGLMTRDHWSGREYGGIEQNKDGTFVWLGTPRAAFLSLWRSIYSKYGDNPPVWVNEFKKI